MLYSFVLFRLPKNMLEWRHSWILLATFFDEMPTMVCMQQETVKMCITRKKS